MRKQVLSRLVHWSRWERQTIEFVPFGPAFLRTLQNARFDL